MGGMETTTALATTTTTDLTTAGVAPDVLAGQWLASLTTPATRDAYRGDLVAWLAFLDGHRVPVLSATRATVDAWRLSMESTPAPSTGRPLSPATIARRLSAVRSFYAYAEDLDLVSRNPAEKAKAPKVSDESPTLGLDKGQAEDVLSAADEEGNLTYALVAVLLYLGLRVSEALSLRVEDLETERGHLVARVTGKGGKRRTVPLPPPAAEAVTSLLDGRTTGPVFLTAAGEPLSRHAASYRVRKVARKAGVPGSVSPHSLRHTTATLALDAGAPLHRVQDLLGHADPRTTQRYNRARQALDGHAAYSLADYLHR